MVMYWCFQWVNRHLMHLVQRILCSSEFRNYDYEAPLKCTTLIKEIRKQTLNLKNKLSNCQMYYSVGSFCYNYHCVSNFCHYFVKGCLFNLEKRLRSMIPLISQLCIISRPIMDHVTGCSSEKTKKYNNDLAKVILDLENILNSPFNKSIHFINDIANNFDFDEQTKYNGFRSTLHVTALCLNHILINLKSLKLEMDPKYIRRIQEFNFVLIQLRSSLYYAEYNFKNHAHITYPESIICQKMVTPNHYVMSQSEKLDQSKFFGYTVGYHYRPSIIHTIRFLSLVQGVMAESFIYNNLNPNASILNQFIKWTRIVKNVLTNRLYRESICKKVIILTRNEGMVFILYYWKLMDLKVVEMLSNVLTPRVQFNELIVIQHGGFDLNIRIISKFPLNNMEMHTKKDHIIFHVHGGGFISQNSKHHEVYLKQWAHELGMTIISVDYTLAPHAKYPTQIFECIAAYDWVLQNKNKFNWNGKKILFAGDSAGSNILFSMVLICLAENKRMPDAIFSHYGVFNVNWSPSPSRALSLMDPLLPLGVMYTCFDAYVDSVESMDEASLNTLERISTRLLKMERTERMDTKLKNLKMNRKESPFRYKHQYSKSCIDIIKQKVFPNSHLLSPAFVSDQVIKRFPPTHFFVSNVDPLLDDSVYFAKRFKTNNTPVSLNVFQGLPHGYLNLINQSKDIKAASNKCVEIMRQT